MKRFLYIVLGAVLTLQGLYEWLLNDNEALSSLPFALAAVCLVLATAVQEENRGLGIFSRLETHEKVFLTVVVVIILAIVGFFLWGIIDNFFPQINWKYFLPFVGAAITAIIIGKLFYFCRSMWSYIMGTEFFGN